uniref:C-type lectin domain-containing protein n=1 Tax=Loa loa TaxID=7209 RepID=A0A1I7VVK7_LOALO
MSVGDSPNDTQGKAEEMIETLEEPIGTRTKRVRKLLNAEKTSKPKFLRTLFVLNVIALMFAQVQAMSNCTWKLRIPFNIPEKWNCEISDQTVTSAITPQLCRAIYANRQVDGINLIQSSPHKWISNNQVQYSYGWLGEGCQSTTNIIINEGEILLDEGRDLVPDLEDTAHCRAEEGESITNSSIVLWNGTDLVNHCIEGSEDSTL